jgi:asparagine synthase (glutamine-hydrolysing)
VRYVSGQWLTELLGAEAERRVQEHYHALFFSPDTEDKPDLIARLLYVNLRTYLLDDLLVKADRSSMAASLEARSPFLDHQLVQFVADIPSELKLKRGISKYILKKALRGLLPDKIIDRKKHGFGVPIGAWFRGELATYVQNILLSERSLRRGLWNKEALRRMIAAHLGGKADLGNALWTLLTFELWIQRYFD